MKGITRTVVFLGVASLLTDAASEMVYPLLPLFLLQLGAGVQFIGIFEGVADSITSITKYIFGYLSDKINKKPLVVAGYSLANLIRPFIGIVVLPIQVLALRFIDRVGKGMRTAPRDAWLASEATQKTRGKVFGFHRSMDHLGAVIGPLLAIGFLFLFPNNLRSLFLWSAIPGALAIFILLLAKSKRDQNVESTSNIFINDETITLPKEFKKYLIILLFFTLGNSSDAFILLKLKSVGIGAKWILLLWSALHVVKSSLSIYAGIISDRIGRKYTILIGWFVFAIVYFMFGLAKTPTLMIISFLLYGIFYAFTEGPEKALVADLAPMNIRGKAYGLFNLVIGITALPSSVVAGIVASQTSLSIIFYYGAVIALISMLFLLKLLKIR